MPLGSAATSTIDIDFTRAQGVNSTGRIIFQPRRDRVGTTIISSFPVEVEIKDGVASVDLVRLPLSTYHVREIIDGRPEFEFSFALPVSSAALIQYEDIAPATVVPTYFTAVRTVNGVAPDPTTGNVVVVGNVGPQGPPGADGEDGEDGAEGIQGIQGLQGIQGIPGTAGTSGSPGVDGEDGAQGPAGEIGPQGPPGTGFPDRIVRISDRSKEPGDVRTYNMPNTDSAWLLFDDGPAEYSIPAAIGDDIEVSYSILIAGASTSSTDLVVVTGPTPTRQRYLSSGTSNPSFGGPAGNYPSDAGFQGRTGVLGFTVEASDLDSGNVRFRWVIKTSTTNGKMYANNNYPLILGIRNTRLSGV